MWAFINFLLNLRKFKLIKDADLIIVFCSSKVETEVLACMAKLE